MIKAAFFDIDNTLFDWKNKRYVPSGIKAVKALKKRGIKVFLCSARPYDSMKRFGAFDLGVKWDGWVASTGSCVSIGGKIIYKEVFDREDAATFRRIAKKHGLMMEIIGLRCRYFNEKPSTYFVELTKRYAEPECPIHPYNGGDITSFMLFSTEETDHFFAEALPHLSYFRFHPYAVDVTPHVHSKGRGIKAILEQFGISSDEAIGFGDEEADVLMKEGLDHLVIVGNGKDSAKAQAEFVAEPISEDGVYKACVSLGLID